MAEQNTILVWSAAAGFLSVTEAVRRAAPLLCSGEGEAVAVLNDPERSRLALVAADGEVTGPDGKRLELSTVFDLRAFSPVAELRWIRKPEAPDGRGKAVLLAARKPVADQGSEWRGEWREEPVRETLSQTYLLWGKADAASADVKRGTDSRPWSRLVENRIGSLHVPLALPAGSGVLLDVLEYLQRIDDHGNVAVIEERLLGLRVERRRSKGFGEGAEIRQEEHHAQG